MQNLIANSVFKAEGRKYQPGEIVPRSLPEWEKLLEKGYIVWEGGAQAAREAADKEAAEPNEKPVKGRKAKAET